MRFQVPQFVDIEDKIVGPFTLKQFLMYVVAVMVLVPVFLLSDLSLFLTIAIPVMGAAAAFAHLKINDQTLATVLSHAASFFFTPQLYIWRRVAILKAIIIKDPQWQELTLTRSEAEEELTSLAATARNLDTQGNVVQSTEDIVDEFNPEEAAG